MIDLTEQEWEALLDKADETIQQLISEFPQDLQNGANDIPCYLSKYASDPERIIWGMANVQQKIIVIYVGQIYETEKGNMDKVKWSVKNAYLHELGHHFDLGEYELKERGL